MKPITTIRELQEKLGKLRIGDVSIGFVPTMGALHAGHLSLVKQALADNDICVVSVFVNPTQFNNKEDLEKYPRTLERDCELLATLSEDVIVFSPSVEEVYPEPDTRQFDFGQLDKVMEGKFRPGHFNGVAQVVSRLFDIVKPDRAYFGQKDFQQLAIIRAMVKRLGLGVEIVPMPIVREASGLALSSRNERLTEEQKLIAVNISKALFASKERMNSTSVGETIRQVINDVNSHEGLEVEYFEIVDGNTLQPVGDWTEADYIVGCITVFCGDVRLIDNIIYKGE
ncbi:pantoate--beta-alanine ligase [Dysgonomonas sp. 25]|uniref:pantoate--beta-alanine ligase n=1 Tax=Dysgonomonas sp. 25 TaxID=2302933 RepID=UPI0013D7197E|nr:pantoate--beta-alanine ligase [Dysgonomonas sp. 25]NDV68923.1 pantoate--beta-alanine ligase [Dysgonomonas sp. 25]